MPPDPQPDHAAVADEHRFAQYVRTLGRGPGRSRALTRDEARDALALVLAGEADPHQVGAFLMLLRYRGEDPAEMAGLVEAGRQHIGAGLPNGMAPVDLDWPSYGAGRTRGAPWFLLAALALGRAGYRVLMHGSNDFTRGVTVEQGLQELGLPAASGWDQAAEHLDARGFAYLPLRVLGPGLDRLLGLRHLLGLRSPVNTACRLLNPCDAGAAVDGVFHPPYIELHLATAELLGQPRLTVVKGGGGEAERTPLKPLSAHWTVAGRGRGVDTLDAAAPVPPGGQDLVSVWQDGAPGLGTATVVATVALGLLALGVAETAAEADAAAARVWQGRHGARIAGRAGLVAGSAI